MDKETIFCKPNGSILNTVKKMLGIDVSYHVFDMDIIVGINSALATLNQLGVIVDSDFTVMDECSKWDEVIKDKWFTRLSFIQQYVYLKVKTLFDPPTSSFVLDAFNKQISELEWRINVEIETIREEERHDRSDISSSRRQRHEMGA